MTHTRQKRFGAALLALMLTISITMTASAATPPNSTGRYPDAANDGSSKISIHKLNLGENDPEDLILPGTGLEVADGDKIGITPGGTDLTLGDLDALDDIEFFIEYYKLNDTTGAYDVQTSAWDSAPISGGTFESLTYGGRTIYGYRGTTAGGGLLEFDNLAFGNYVFYEIDSGDFFGRDDPFTVNVPTALSTTSDGVSEWIYDIHVYPKNYDSGEFEKYMLDNEGNRVVGEPTGDPNGNRFVWEMEVELRNLNTMQYIEIIDTFVSSLTFTNTAANLWIEYTKDGLPARHDLDATHYDTSYVGKTLTVRLDGTRGNTGNTGLDFLAGEKADKLIISVVTYTDPDTTQMGTLTNKGTYKWKEWDKDEEDKETPDPDKPRTELNDIEIKKVDDTDEVMKDVKFILFKSKTAAAAFDGTAVTLSDATCVVKDPAATGLARYTYTSDATGMIYIKNVASAYIPAGTSTPSVYFNYYLVELETLSGYNLLPAPVHIDFEVHHPDKVEITVVNQTGFTLPHTGGRGTLLFTVVGLSLITVAVVILIVYRRKKNAGKGAA